MILAANHPAALEAAHFDVFCFVGVYKIVVQSSIRLSINICSNAMPGRNDGSIE